MKTIIILLSSLLFAFFAHGTNCHKEGGHSHDEVTTNGLSSGEITNNFININVNGMVCDFCAQSIEKVFMKRIEVKECRLGRSKGSNIFRERSRY